MALTCSFRCIAISMETIVFRFVLDSMAVCYSRAVTCRFIFSPTNSSFFVRCICVMYIPSGWYVFTPTYRYYLFTNIVNVYIWLTNCSFRSIRSKWGYIILFYFFLLACGGMLIILCSYFLWSFVSHIQGLGFLTRYFTEAKLTDMSPLTRVSSCLLALLL